MNPKRMNRTAPFRRVPKVIFVAIWLTATQWLSAKEGMWIPTLLQAVEGEMQAMGLHLTAQDIYDINSGSLKDAIVHFGGGCTAEMVSETGLLFTNHHCGFGQIAAHSSVERDLLRDGFWAKNLREELTNPGLTATFIDRIEDVTAQLKAVPEAEREAKKAELVKAYTEGKALEGKVVAFDFGNAYYLITTRTFRDVRLVGAPPSAVGKFGGDTDNWVWPRHTGDFAVFRIYANALNEPAPIDVQNNVPFRPAHHLPVSLRGVQEGDFTMVFGFPGVTEQYLTADAVEHLVDVLNPARIAMRDASLAVINAARSSSPALRIAYADRQSSIANAWKKWIGQSQGLQQLGAVQKKRDLEAEFLQRAAASGSRTYAPVVQEMNRINGELFPLLEARALFIEYYYYGSELWTLTGPLQNLIARWDEWESAGTLSEKRKELAGQIRESSRSLDPSVELQLLSSLTPLYKSRVPSAYLPSVFEGCPADGAEAWVQSQVAKSLLWDLSALADRVEKGSKKQVAQLERDPLVQWGTSVQKTYQEMVAPGWSALRPQLEAQQAVYTAGLRALFPERAFFPDANSTLRLTYGRVEGSAPQDGMRYEPFTTAQGILQKYVPGDADFDLPADLLQMLRDRRFGRYARPDGELPVCFTGSNHTTGGNSGSPALNGDGHLIGINFDRSWESTMSDVLFDGSRCRNIMVDIRYVLWVMDVYAGAGHLVEEMTLVE